MTKADIETILNELAATTRYLQESGRLTRAAAEHVGEVADHIATVSEHIQEVIAHIDGAITAALTHLHGDHDTPNA